MENAKAPGQVDASARANATQAAQRMEHAQAVGQVQKSDQISFNKASYLRTNATQAETAAHRVAQREAPSKSESFFKSVMKNMEEGEKHIQGMLGAKNMKWDQQTLIQMQAGMYKYTQELELTGKVVEKATSGLKDTLKTQV
ncbi:MAG: ATP-dependent helicase HrpB [Myxococcaceae bacterium]